MVRGYDGEEESGMIGTEGFGFRYLNRSDMAELADCLIGHYQIKDGIPFVVFYTFSSRGE